MNKEEKSAEKKQIKLDVKYRIARGESKQQILEELSCLYKDKVTIVKQLEKIPSNVMRQKYRIHNYFLAFLLLCAFTLDILLLFRLPWGNAIVDITSIIHVVLDVVFIVGVLLYRIEIYSWIATRALVAFLNIIISRFYYFQVEDYLIYFSLALIIISFILGLLIGVKLCPPRVPKTIEIDIDGTEKINKTIHVFPD